MRRTILVLSCLGVVLAGCFENPLTKDKINLLAAMVYVAWGTEEGDGKWGDATVERKIHSQSLEYISKHVQYGISRTTVTETADCVFQIQMKDDAKSWGTVEVIDLNKAIKFEFGGTGQRGIFGGLIELEGPQVYCRVDEKKCVDYHVFPVLESGAKISDEEYQNVLKRRSRAVRFLRQACPGKPF